MVSEGELLAQDYHDDQQRKVKDLHAELARCKYALAKCLAAMQEDAHDSDGYSEREIEACELAAPIVGIEWSCHYGAYDEKIYSMKPSPVEVVERLQP